MKIAKQYIITEAGLQLLSQPPYDADNDDPEVEYWAQQRWIMIACGFLDTPQLTHDEAMDNLIIYTNEETANDMIGDLSACVKNGYLKY